MKTGFELIQNERQRQISQEGWAPEHDDSHTKGELELAAKLYVQRGINASTPVPAGWPWSAEWWKPSDDEVRNLVKGGALFLAETERRMRAGQNGAAGTVSVYVDMAAVEIDRLNKHSSN